MGLSPVEIIALVFIILGLVKVLVLLFSSKAWVGVVKAIYKIPTLLAVIELILAGIVFYYLIQEVSIIHIIAVIALGALLTGMTLVVYAKELMPAVTKMLKGGILKKAWLPLIVWLVLIIWGLTALF